MKKASSLSLQEASKAWCGKKTSHKEMDADLAEEFALILDSIWTKPWLGNATTRELLEEIMARVDLDYKTTGDE